MLKANSFKIEPKRILYIEDDAITALAQKNMLMRNGYVVVHKNSGEKALEFLAQGEHVDLVLSDVDLGKGLSGPQTAEEILKIRNIPIVFLTSHAEKDFVEKVKKITRHGYVIKSSGDFVVMESIEMAFELFEANSKLEKELQARALIEAELRKKNEALRLGEERFRSITENQTELICRYLPDGKLSFINGAYSAYYKLDSEDLLNKNFIPLIPEPDLSIILEKIKSITIESPRVSFIHRIINSSGETRWQRWTQSGIFSPEGTLLEYQAVGFDITVYKQAEKALMSSEINFRTFFNTNSDFLFVLDEKGHIITANKTVHDRLKYSEGDLINNSVIDVHPEDRRAEAARVVAEMLEGKTDSCFVPIESKDRVQIPVETRVVKGFWDGAPALFGTSKDISQLRLSEEKFSKVFYLNPSACGLSDITTNKYVEVNEAFYALLGFEKNEVIGNSAVDLGILNQDTIKSVLEKADINGNIVNAEAELKAKNGEYKDVLLSAENIYIQDKKYRFTIVTDITERKKDDNRIKTLLEKNVSLLKEKEYLLREVHHRVKNNMNFIVGFLYLQEETLENEEAKEALKNAENRVRSMMVLFDKLYRAENVQVASTQEYFSSLVQEIISNMSNGGEVGIDSSGIANIMLEAEVLFSLGILINELLTNIVKYAFPKEVVLNDAPLIKISFQKGLAGLWELIIADNGVGLPEAFDIMNSTGFGMSLVYMLVEQLKGKMEVNSQPNQGTKFVISFRS